MGSLKLKGADTGIGDKALSESLRICRGGAGGEPREGGIACEKSRSIAEAEKMRLNPLSSASSLSSYSSLSFVLSSIAAP